MNRRNGLFALVTVLGFVADQLTKAWVVANIELYRGEITIIPQFFSLVHTRNTGAAFGSLRDFEYRWVVFAFFTCLAVGILVDQLRRCKPTEWFLPSVLGLLMSGALGNAVDRIRQQYVVDFLKMYAGFEPVASWSESLLGTTVWPSYNIADISLVVGVVVFVAHYVWTDEETPATNVPDDNPRPSDTSDE